MAKMYKRLLAALLTILMILSMTACGGSKETVESTKAPAAA